MRRPSYQAEVGETRGIFAVGTARVRPPPDCPKCRKPSVTGSDYLACCKNWLITPMFCNLCHSATRALTFNRSDCRGRWSLPMCGADGNTDVTPGDGHVTATAEEMAIVLRHHGRVAALRER